MLERLAAMSFGLPHIGSGAALSHTGVQTFSAGALRLDLRHQRIDGVETFVLRSLRFEPSWGARVPPRLSTLDWGDYRLSLYDDRRAVLFRVGFDTALERAQGGGATRLSVRCPMPSRSTRVVIEKRRAAKIFQDVWTSTLDPHDSAIDRTERVIPDSRVHTVLSNGVPSAKVDIAILGDGYAARDYSKFSADAARAAEYLFSADPFRRRKNDFNVSAVFVPSMDAGISDDYEGIRKSTAFGGAFLGGDAERTIAIRRLDSLYEAASAVPYDFILVLANARRYGGSSIFGGPAVAAIDSAAAPYLVVHEFAHVIGGLADEYYVPKGDGPAYAGNVEPWNPNVTIRAGSEKWRDLANAPARASAWNKSEYEIYFSSYVRRYYALRAAHAPEAAVESLMREARNRTATLLAKDVTPRQVGWFEGGNGYAKGVFRSETDCVMFSLRTDRFCSACSQAIERNIDEHCG